VEIANSCCHLTVVSNFWNFLRLPATVMVGNVSSLELVGAARGSLFSGADHASEKAYRGSCAINNVARQIMATYSLLFIDANEHIGRSRQIECLTDQQAVDSAAKEPGDYRAVQVWDGDRPIALVGNPRSPGEDF
jgi:hypothetical protein